MDQQVHETATEVVGEVRSYVEEFNRGDFAACVTHYSFPFTYVSAAGSSWVGSREEFLRTWPEIWARMRAAGWDSSSCVEHNVTLLGDGLALESHALIRRDAAGQEMEVIGSTFVLRRDGSAWRLASCLQHPPEAVIRTGVPVPAAD